LAINFISLESGRLPVSGNVLALDGFLDPQFTFIGNFCFIKWIDGLPKWK
jgi:hypothetical protein